jgi:hypothetical protein
MTWQLLASLSLVKPIDEHPNPSLYPQGLQPQLVQITHALALATLDPHSLHPAPSIFQKQRLVFHPGTFFAISSLQFRTSDSVFLLGLEQNLSPHLYIFLLLLACFNNPAPVFLRHRHSFTFVVAVLWKGHT